MAIIRRSVVTETISVKGLDSSEESSNEVADRKATGIRRSVRVATRRTKQADKVAEMYGRTLLGGKVSSAHKSTVCHQGD